MALVAGNQWGEDDHFPFAPMRMYAHRTAGEVKELKLEATTASGALVPARFADFRMRRAEVAGQVPLFSEEPARLRHLALAYAEAHPEAEPLARLRLFYAIYPLDRSGRVSGYREETIAVWRGP